MKKYFDRKYLGLLALSVMVAAGAFFTVQAQTANDNFDFGFFQCTRHGFNEHQNCNGVWNYYGSRNDYVGGSVSYNWAGHRHGSSGINSEICLVASSGAVECEVFSCAGGTCGYEYGGQHPWNEYWSGNISFSSPPSSYRIYRRANVTDAEVRLSASGYAVYSTAIPGCTNSAANNYNPAATVDDGSCTFNLVNLNFIVRTQTNNPIPGALIVIDQNFGNGTNRTTDGGGFANFGVNRNTNIGYTVTATGCTATNGSVNSGNDGITREVTMNCSTGGGGGVGDRPVCTPNTQNTFIGQAVSFMADSQGGGPVTWSAPGGSPVSGSGLNFSTSFASAGTRTVTASNNNGSTYFSSCTVNVQAPTVPPPQQVIVDRPACSNVPYNAHISWSGFAPEMVDGVSSYFVDITTDSTWASFWNKRITDGSTSSIALDTFSCLAGPFPGNHCPGAPVGENMILQPEKTYYARVFTGSGHQPSSQGTAFNVPRCDPPPVLQMPTLPACVPPGETYGVTLNWTGSPHPQVGSGGYYADVTTDPSFASFWNKPVPAFNNSTPALSGFSCSSGNWCFNPPAGPMSLQPGTTYYARILGGGGHSNIVSFGVPQCRLLSVSYGGTGSGIISGPPGVSVSTGFPFPTVHLADGISCGPGQTNCSEWYVDGASVNLNATPAGAGNSFGSWASGGAMVCPGSTLASCAFTINTNRTAQANFNAIAAFDYALSAPPVVTVIKGNSISQPVTRNLSPGSTPQPVVLSLSGVPSGVSYTIAANHPSPSCSASGCSVAAFSNPSNIVFTVPASVPAGDYPITAIGSPLNRSIPFTLRVTDPAVSVLCSASATQVYLGQSVTWTAIASGANPPFQYSWSGTGFSPTALSSSNTHTVTYSTIGFKTASVFAIDSTGVGEGPVPCTPTQGVRVIFSPIFIEF